MSTNPALDSRIAVEQCKTADDYKKYGLQLEADEKEAARVKAEQEKKEMSLDKNPRAMGHSPEAGKLKLSTKSTVKTNAFSRLVRSGQINDGLELTKPFLRWLRSA